MCQNLINIELMFIDGSTIESQVCAVDVFLFFHVVVYEYIKLVNAADDWLFCKVFMFCFMCIHVHVPFDCRKSSCRC